MEEHTMSIAQKPFGTDQIGRQMTLYITDGTFFIVAALFSQAPVFRRPEN